MSYKRLKVYQSAYELAKRIHKITDSFPASEKYELGSQARRAAVSVALNIVEGYGRQESPGEFQHYLRNALGSCNEVLVILNFCLDFGYIESDTYEELDRAYNYLGRQIYRLRKTRVRGS